MSTELPERIESKYLIPMTHSFVLNSIFQHFPQSQWKTYSVHSLYYDTLDLMAYHQKKNGDSYRKKFRLRYYDNQNDSFFAEIKEKRGQVVLKTREKIKTNYNFNFSSTFIPLMEKISEDDIRSGYIPMLWTQYQRKALELHSNSYLRVTIDKNIGFQQFNNTTTKSSIGPVFQDTVVEVKHSPNLKNNWLGIISKYLRPYQSNFSKYEWALEHGKKGIKWI